MLNGESWERQTHTTTHPGLLPLSALIGGASGQIPGRWPLREPVANQTTNTQSSPHSRLAVPRSSSLQTHAPLFSNSSPDAPGQNSNTETVVPRCPCAASSLSSRYLVPTPAAQGHARGDDVCQPSMLGLRQEEEHVLGDDAESCSQLHSYTLSSAANGLGSRCFTATSSGYSASTSIAFRSTTKYNAAPRAVWRGHPWLTCSWGARNVLRYL
ncbi:uncharacterized protein B0H64DRAFT_193807 [Chaetomium fimeti]|uniref:Uncharacterized protein n=1 Tax=Chaetomium fimeti TaxID=1854472 RepID=A0AAE0HDT5_9PEZI|nr:hypothetical protein B0H64DRAFT_193807 [Chaetomium fimeti]